MEEIINAKATPPGWEADLFRLLVENTKDYAVFVVDPEGRVLTWNPGAERVLGYRDSEILGQSSFITFTPEDRAQGIPEKELQTALREGRASDDRWHIRKDGTRLWVSGVMVLLRSEQGAVQGLAKVMRDFTEAKLSAEALRESEGRLRVALSAAEMGTWLWRIPTDEQVLDDSLRRLMGLEHDRKVGNLDDFLAAVYEEDRARVRAEFERCLRAGGDFNVEFRVLRPNGEVRWLRDQGKRFADQEGKPLFMTGACVDITERKRDEQSLRDADRRKTEFLALLAHELRNPLAPIRTNLQVIRLSAEDPAVTAHARGVMDRQLAHMVRLIDDLLDISRLSQNKLRLQRRRLSLADAIGNAVETAKPMIDEAGHELHVSLPAEPVLLHADLTRLAQVFSNLLTNSAKYTRRGGQIWLTAERQRQEVVVSVRDTGIGIPPNALSHIFDMFSQVDRSIERTTGGLGIGLALVKGLVEMHGGAIEVFSAGPDKGSTFTVRLPTLADDAQVRVDPPVMNDQRVAISGRRILVVDDNLDSANSMAQMLGLLGNEVRTAHDGLEAFEQAQAYRPEIILMDIGMPRLNGLEASRRIREQPWGASMTIVALTGWGQEVDRLLSSSAGCNGHLVKPVSLPDLQKLLAELAAVGNRHGRVSPAAASGSS